MDGMRGVCFPTVAHAVGAGDARLVVAELDDGGVRIARIRIIVDQGVQGAADGRVRVVHRVVAFAAYGFEQVEQASAPGDDAVDVAVFVQINGAFIRRAREPDILRVERECKAGSGGAHGRGPFTVWFGCDQRCAAASSSRCG